MVLKNATKMPIATNAGNLSQLGGEFVLGPGLSCSFVARMSTTRAHTPIRDVLDAAGVNATVCRDLAADASPEQRKRWMDIREDDLNRMIRRRIEPASCTFNSCG